MASHGEEGEPLRLRYAQLVSTRPGAAFAFGCGTHCSLFLLFLILTVAVGNKFLNMTTGVALHIWENEWYRVSRAHAEGTKICNWDNSLVQVQEQQTVSRIPAGEMEYKLEIVYQAGDGNMLDVRKLKRVKELEDRILGGADYEKFCLRRMGTSSCQWASIASACNVMLSGGQNCNAATASPPGFFQCTSAECSLDRSKWEIDQAFLDMKVGQFASFEFRRSPLETMALGMMDSNFGGGSGTAAALRSEFTFAFPLAGYNSTGDRPAEQVKEVEAFMEDAFFELLDKYNDEEGEASGFHIGYRGGPLQTISMNTILQGDIAFIGLSFVVVWLYVAIMSQSLFVATLAMGQIFLCFGSGFIVYRIFVGSFFGTFHIMAIFLLMGIGVDDVFVMLDHFEAALHVRPSFKEDLGARMSWTWKHAAMAMGVTSLTTSVSFCMNATSSFYGIKAFGVFAACLIMVNYLSMLFYFPTVISFSQRFLARHAFLCGLPEKASKLCPNTSEEAVEAAEENVEAAQRGDKPRMVLFFENYFSFFILGHRLKILFLFAVATGFMCSRLPELVAEKVAPEFLPDTHPMSLYPEVMKTSFVRGGGMFNTKVSVMFGFDADFLDSEGTDGSGQGYGDEDAIGSQGTVKWDRAWYVDAAKTETRYDVIFGSYDCVIQLCDAAEAKDPSRNTGGPPSYLVRGCFQRDIKNFLADNVLLATQANTSWAKITGGDLEAFKSAAFLMFANTSGLYPSNDDMMRYIFAERSDSGNAMPFVRYFLFELTLTSGRFLDTDVGNQLAEDWKAWVSSEMGKGSCADRQSLLHPLIHAPDFHQFKVTETILQEMVQGIGVSVTVALAVLILATGNVFLGFFAAFSIGMIVLWVIAMVPVNGWELGIVENLALVMVPGLSVDYVAHLAEAYNQAKYDNREHRVVHMLGHSGISVVSGSISTLLAGCCLLLCQIVFFTKFGTILVTTVCFSILWSLFFFPSVLCLIGPVGAQGDWHQLIHPCLQHDMGEVHDLPIRPSRSSSFRREGSKITPMDTE